MVPSYRGCASVDPQVAPELHPRLAAEGRIVAVAPVSAEGHVGGQGDVGGAADGDATAGGIFFIEYC